MDMTARTTPGGGGGGVSCSGDGHGGGLSIVPPTKTPEAESEALPRIQASKPFSFSNGVLKRHALPQVVYKECLKNHAASLGGHALDGCGEFMPAPNATPTDPMSLKCAACGCHRNFHRREPEDLTATNAVANTTANTATLTHVIEYHPHHRHHPIPPPVPSRVLHSPGSQSPPPISSTYYPGSAPHMLLALSSGVGGGGPDGTTQTAINGPHSQHVMMNSSSGGSRKRFRTKFSPEQKEKMLEFAEKVGWKMHKTNEEMLNGFCNEIGVERGVFKVWMHNNKNTFGKRSTTPSTATNPTTADNHQHGLNVDDDDDDDDDDGNEEICNLNGNGNGNGNDNIINNHNNHHHHHINQHNHLQQPYNNGGKSNENNAAPTNASSSSS